MTGKGQIQLIFCFSLIAITSVAQITITGRAGYGTYAMSSVSAFQSNRLKESGLPAKLVENFPGFINYKIYLGKQSKENLTKFYIGYLTSGARTSLTDYSGQLFLDIIANGIQAGIQRSFTDKYGSFKLKYYFDMGTTTTFLSMKDYIRLGTETYSDTYLFMSHGLDFEPGVATGFQISRFNVEVYVGYMLDYSLSFYKKGSPRVKLGTSERDIARAEWRGLRTGILLTFPYAKKEQD